MSMMIPVYVPGFEGRQVWVQTPGAFSSSKLFVDGRPATPGPKRGQFLLHRNDGWQVVASFKGGFPDPIPMLVVNGQAIRLAQPLAWYEWIWIGLPLLLLFLGGAIGGALGGAAMAVNAQLFRSQPNPAARYLLSGMVSAACVGIWLAIAVAITVARGG